MTHRSPITTAHALILFLAGTALYSYSAWAGPLNPPAGPVTSTYKTLTEVEPRTAVNATNTPGDADSLYKITQPGSYYLTGNITGVVGKHGIEIVASGVTLDVMGFELLGVPGSLDGISATVGVNNVEVRNGSVRSWGDEGLDFTNGGSIGIADVNALTCAGFGISINQNSTATRCKMNSNGAGGIATGINCVVIGCAAYGNTGGGILAWVGCRVVDCTAFTNTGDGISAGNGSTITGCSATDSTSDGIAVTNGCTISNCSASSNDVHGINAGNDCVITDCSTRSNFGGGINSGNGCTITNCSASLNSGTGVNTASSGTITNCSAYDNGANGIVTGTSCAVSNCTANFNTGHGIFVGSFNMVIDCSAIANTLDGIRTDTGGCAIRGNTCQSNGIGGIGAGIHSVTGSDNRIEGNNCTGADRGIEVNGAGNIIIRNTCSGNTTNWVISVGNSVGPIVVAGFNAAAISGNGPVASTLGSTDPHANFTY